MRHRARRAGRRQERLQICGRRLEQAADRLDRFIAGFFLEIAFGGLGERRLRQRVNPLSLLLDGAKRMVVIVAKEQIVGRHGRRHAAIDFINLRARLAGGGRIGREGDGLVVKDEGGAIAIAVVVEKIAEHQLRTRVNIKQFVALFFRVGGVRAVLVKEQVIVEVMDGLAGGALVIRRADDEAGVNIRQQR